MHALLARVCLAAVAASSLTAFSVPTAIAQSAESSMGLDPSWGRSGLAVLSVPGDDARTGQAVHIAGTTYVAVQVMSQPFAVAIAALDSAGRPVTTFGDRGRLSLPPGSGTGLFDDRRGGLLVHTVLYGNTSSDRRSHLRRVDLGTGALDEAFGEGGQVTVPDAFLYDLPGLTVDSHGRIYVPTGTPDTTRGIARLTPQGGLDTTWGEQAGTPGRRDVPEFFAVGGLHVDSQDRLLVTGSAGDGSGSQIVVRMLPDGTRDDSFALTRTDWYTSKVVKSGDGLMTFHTLIGECGNEVRRYDAEGQPDADFGDNGRMDLRYPGAQNCLTIRDITSDAAGRVTAVALLRRSEDAHLLIQLGLTGAVDSEVVLGVTDIPSVDGSGSRGAPYSQVDLSADGRALITGTDEWNGRLAGVVRAVVENADSYLPPALQAQPGAAGRQVDDSCPAGRVPSAGFGDITAGAPHADSVDCVVWWKVAGGRSSTEYAPGAPVNRAQMATFIANAIEKSGDTLPEPSEDWFDDDNGTTHERNINRLAEAGIISGRAPGVYAPDGLVSRGAMTKFLAVSYEYTSGEELPSHVDYFADDNGHVLELFINQAAAVGLAAGSGSGYNPGGDVRRDQMATFIARWLDLVVERFDAQLPDER